MTTIITHCSHVTNSATGTINTHTFNLVEEGPHWKLDIPLLDIHLQGDISLTSANMDIMDFLLLLLGQVEHHIETGEPYDYWIQQGETA